MADAHVVEVNDCMINATRSGIDWWSTFSVPMDRIGRITWVDMVPGGGIAHVACDDRAHATWLRDHMIDMGVPRKAVKVRRLREEAARG